MKWVLVWLIALPAGDNGEFRAELNMDPNPYYDYVACQEAVNEKADELIEAGVENFTVTCEERDSVTKD